jgi:hypothetical protein
MTTGKPNLRSAGGCILEAKPAEHVLAALKKDGREAISIEIKKGYRLKTYAQTAVALRKVWTELARLVDKGVVLRFPLVQLVRENGDSEFSSALNDLLSEPPLGAVYTLIRGRAARPSLRVSSARVSSSVSVSALIIR